MPGTHQTTDDRMCQRVLSELLEADGQQNALIQREIHAFHTRCLTMPAAKLINRNAVRQP